jgi:predicted phage gp36 major capsid-like protein
MSEFLDELYEKFKQAELKLQELRDKKEAIRAKYKPTLDAMELELLRVGSDIGNQLDEVNKARKDFTQQQNLENPDRMFRKEEWGGREVMQE